MSATPPNADAVFMSACIGAMFGPAPESAGVEQAFAELCVLAGVTIRTPDGLAGLCCGTPWKSKGHQDGYEAMAAKVLPALWHATNEGELPVITDASSCTEGLHEMLRSRPNAYSGLRVVDSVTFARTQLLPLLEVRRRLPSLTIHPTCSSARLGATDDLLAIAHAIADEVHTPSDWGCCAFAGDRGLLHPELTASATAAEAAQVVERPTKAYASMNRTCEIGMTRATGQPYRHILELVLEAASPQK